MLFPLLLAFFQIYLHDTPMYMQITEIREMFINLKIQTLDIYRDSIPTVTGEAKVFAVVFTAVSCPRSLQKVFRLLLGGSRKRNIWIQHPRFENCPCRTCGSPIHSSGSIDCNYGRYPPNSTIFVQDIWEPDETEFDPALELLAGEEKVSLEEEQETLEQSAAPGANKPQSKSHETTQKSLTKKNSYYSEIDQETRNDSFSEQLMEDENPNQFPLAQTQANAENEIGWGNDHSPILPESWEELDQAIPPPLNLMEPITPTKEYSLPPPAT